MSGLVDMRGPGTCDCVGDGGVVTMLDSVLDRSDVSRAFVTVDVDVNVQVLVHHPISQTRVDPSECVSHAVMTSVACWSALACHGMIATMVELVFGLEVLAFAVLDTGARGAIQDCIWMGVSVNG
jgi:hypothetical protein